MIAFPQGKIIYSAGQKVDTFYIIRKGCVRVSFPGGSYTLRSGDVIGIWEIGNGITSMEYQVEEDMEALNYPFGAAQMKRLFDSSVEVMKCFMSSCFRQFNEILVQYRAFREEGVGLEKSLHDNFAPLNASQRRGSTRKPTLISCMVFLPRYQRMYGGFYSCHRSCLDIKRQSVNI